MVESSLARRTPTASGQVHGEPPPRHDPDASVGVGEARPLGRDEEVAGEGQLEPAGDRDAVDGADHRRVHVREGAAGGARLAGGRGLAEGVAAGGELLEVDPGAERGVGAGEDDRGDVVALVELAAAWWGSPCAGRGSARCGRRDG